jgi:hypothetical protein
MAARFMAVACMKISLAGCGPHPTFLGMEPTPRTNAPETMNILYYDCFAGLSGDMNLAAMLDLGVDQDQLRAGLSRLGLDHEFELRVSRDARHGIHGTRVDVVARQVAEHRHDHDDHAHGPSRNLADITAIIRGSGLDQAVQDTSLAIFQRLAKAEARVHGTSVDQVHFHEVGATDAIVDIVGAAICRHLLHVDAVWSSPVELGGGFTRCAHGLLPVPAPATVEILHGVPTTRGAVPHETTTPTGAAILATMTDRFTASPALIVDKTGHGVGHRDGDIPNVLRVHLARIQDEAWASQDACLLQCNIDDMTAETLGAVMEELMAAGAMDVDFTPIQMKKNRPATRLSLLCARQDEPRFADLVFRQTTTLGLKSIPVRKMVLDIAFEQVETPLGPVTFKHALREGVVVRSKPELEDCRRLAARHGIPLLEVYARIGWGGVKA